MPEPQADAFAGGLHLLRRAGRRRPVRREPRPHGELLRRARREPRARRGLPQGRRARRRGARRTTSRPASASTVRARQVVNATGVWTDDTQAMVGERGQFKVRASKGVHLVVPRDRFQSKLGLLLRTEKSVLFVIPWGRHWLIGTTDTDWNLDKAHPAATAADIDYLLDHVNRVLAVPLTRDDVEGVYAGLRPLLAGESEQTSKLSREHIVAHSVPGLVVVAGGKWTTYRIMAKDAIDAAVAALDGRDARVDHPGHRPARRRGLPGGVEQARARSRARSACTGCASSTCSTATASLAGGTARPHPRPPRAAGEPLPGADDYLARRGRLRRDPRGRPAPRRRARPPHPHLDRGLGPRRLRGTRRGRAHGGRPRLGCRRAPSTRSPHYLERVRAERASQLQPDDASADRVRLDAPEIG